MKVRPELNLIGRDDVLSGGKWRVSEVRPVRGEPKTCVDQKVMMIPLGNDETARCIRTHEMIHAKISPTSEDFIGWLARGVASEQALIIAEESRVNYLTNKLGLPTEKFMADGREQMDARDFASNGDWPALVASQVASVWTASEKVWSKTCEEMGFIKQATQLRHIADYVRDFWVYTVEPDEDIARVDEMNDDQIKKLAEIVADPEKYMESKVGDSGNHITPEERYTSANLGFMHTEELAQEVDKWLRAGALVEASGRGDNVIEGLRESEINLCKQGWDTLRWSPVKPMRSVVGAVSRKRIATNVGKYPRRIERLLSDPERRIFDTVKKASGGFVIIDASGSMEFDAEQIEQMVLAAPGCTVFAYSAPDDPRDYSPSAHGYAEHTAWVLAHNGKTLTRDQISAVADDACGGNGVDRPALEWAISQRKNKKQPIVWVTDGHIHGDLSEIFDVVQLAKRENVMYAEDCYSAVELLKQLKHKRHIDTDLPEGMVEALDAVISDLP